MPLAYEGPAQQRPVGDVVVGMLPTLLKPAQAAEWPGCNSHSARQGLICQVQRTFVVQSLGLQVQDQGPLVSTQPRAGQQRVCGWDEIRPACFRVQMQECLKLDGRV